MDLKIVSKSSGNYQSLSPESRLSVALQLRCDTTSKLPHHPQNRVGRIRSDNAPSNEHGNGTERQRQRRLCSTTKTNSRVCACLTVFGSAIVQHQLNYPCSFLSDVPPSVHGVFLCGPHLKMTLSKQRQLHSLVALGEVSLAHSASCPRGHKSACRRYHVFTCRWPSPF